MSVAVDKIIAEVRALSPDEQQQLRERLSALAVSTREDDPEDAFERELMAEGILGEVGPLPDEDPEFYAYRPITASGQPISETIIEERR